MMMRKTTVFEITFFMQVCSLILIPLFLIVCLAGSGMAAESKAKSGDKEYLVPKTLEGQEYAIPLYTKDPSINMWKERRTDLSEGRKPGPINIQRFPGGFYPAGIPTFFRSPVALVPEDLKAGKVDVAMIGAYTDMGSACAVPSTARQHSETRRCTAGGE
jgi:hypothetical protein